MMTMVMINGIAGDMAQCGTRTFDLQRSHFLQLASYASPTPHSLSASVVAYCIPIHDSCADAQIPITLTLFAGYIS